VNGKYAVEDLEKAYRLHERSEEVYNKYKDYGGAHTIGFCASIGHAEEMASFFRSKGVIAEAVHSSMESHKSYRELLVENFREKKIHVLFAVDIFNEGVDIPEIDTVMFLRPTESYVVFLQQLGRGLRKHEGKGRLTVIDFIGNYKRAHYKPLLLAGKNPMLSEKRGVHPEDLDYPVGCQVTFDLRVIDLFKELKKRDPLAGRLRDEFYRLKAELGRRPTRTDLFTGSDMDHKEFMREGYLRYLSSIGELNEVEESWIGSEIEGFLRKMEKTSMSRSYKIPVLLALTENEGTVTYEELGEYFMRFYHCDFLEFEPLEKVHGIWACASLLHVEESEQRAVLLRYKGFLHDDGVFFMSFKYGQGSYEKNGRRFFCHTLESLEEMILEAGDYEILHLYTTEDVRKDRKDEMWSTAIIRLKR